jgi:transposase
MIANQVRIFVCTQPQDLRRSFDGLTGVVRQVMGQEPDSGALFLFVNKRSNRLKIFWVEMNGWCMLYKRLSGAVFRLPVGAGACVCIEAAELRVILRGQRTGRGRGRLLQ